MNCNGALPLYVGNTCDFYTDGGCSCFIEMSLFTDVQLGYSLFDEIVVRVSALNNKGRSEYNSVTLQGTQATVKTVPADMPSNTITRGEDTSDLVLHIQWSPLVTPTETGDSEILSYELQYDQGTNTWVTVVGNPDLYTETEVMITQDVEPGILYSFRVKAKNVYGWAS